MKRSLVLVSLLLVGGVLALLFLLDRGPRRTGRAAQTSEARAGAPPAAPSPSGAPVALARPPREEQAAPAPAEPERAAVTADAATESFALQGARWLDVVVQLPAGVPADEEARLFLVTTNDAPARAQDGVIVHSVAKEGAFSGVAAAGDGESIGLSADPSGTVGDQAERFARTGTEPARGGGREWAVREVPPAGGTVRMPVPPDARAAALVVQGRYLHSDSVSMWIAEAPGTLEVAPELGAWITGRCVLPPGAERRGVRAEGVRVSTTEDQPSPFDWGERGEEGTPCAPDLSFELCGVDPDATVLVGKSACMRDAEVVPLGLHAGEHRTVELTFELGGQIAGRVLGEDGQPIEGAMIGLGKGMFAFLAGSATSAADGTFLLSGTKTGELQLSVQAAGWLPEEGRKIQVAEGQDLAAVEIVLSRGASISGRVLWPDERPAKGVTVSEPTHMSFGGQMPAAPVVTDADGRFTLSGLDERTRDLELRVVVAKNDDPGAPPVAAAPAADEESSLDDDAPPAFRRMFPDDDSADGTPWVTFVRSVAPGTKDLVVHLEPPLTLTGTVVDEKGAAVPSFTLAAYSSLGGAVSGEFEDGAFELDGLFPGSWQVRVDADGFAQGDSPSITMPRVEGPLHLVLTRAAQVSGLVLQPDGTPAADASVVGAGDSSTVDEEGRFHVAQASAGAVTLVASHPRWADSAPLTLDLAPGEERKDVVLQLRAGGRITGEVVDAEGGPAVGRNVSFSTRGFDFGNEDGVPTDAQGHFVLEHVTPGKGLVVAGPTRAELMSQLEDGGEPDPAGISEILGKILTAPVEVHEGEEVHVVLGGTPRRPVRVFGRVTEADAGVEGASVYAIAEGGSIVQGMKIAQTDARGAYELTVDRPGAYLFAVDASGGLGGLGTEFYVDVPEAAEHEQPLALPTGRLAGRVIGPDGAPVQGMGISAVSEDGAFGLGAGAGGGPSQLTGADGAFVLAHLRAGTYTVRATQFGSPTPQGATPLGGIRLPEGGSVEGLELRLGPSCEVRGIVRDDTGAPVHGAAVFVRDASGRLVSSVSSVTTDGAGRFTYGGLPAGELTVSARDAERVSAEEVRARVGERSPADVELTLVHGTTLVVECTQDDEPVRARVRILDEHGHDLAGMISEQDFQDLASQGFSSRSQRFGPLPPGEVTVLAVGPSGEEAKKPVRLGTGGGERKVHLRLR